MAMTVKEALEYTRQQAIESGARHVSPEERADFLRSLPDEERRKEIDMDIAIGRSAPRYKGVWGEIGAGSCQSFVKIAGKVGFGDWSQSVLRCNQQWRVPENGMPFYAWIGRYAGECWFITVPLLAVGGYFCIRKIVRKIKQKIQIRRAILRQKGENKEKNMFYDDKKTVFFMFGLAAVILFILLLIVGVSIGVSCAIRSAPNASGITRYQLIKDKKHNTYYKFDYETGEFEKLYRP